MAMPPNTLVHRNDGSLLRPNEDPFPSIPAVVEETTTDHRHRPDEQRPLRPSHRSDAERSLTVTRYRQEWSLLPNPATRVVHARMTVDYTVESGTFASGFKSLSDGSPHSKSVRGINVTDGRRLAALEYKSYERDGYHFIRWFYASPVSGGEVASTIVEYDIHGAVEGCSSSSRSSVGGARGEGEDVANETTSALCSESFRAPWANYWSVPVNDIAYSFELRPPAPPPADDVGYAYVPGSIVLDEPVPCCSRRPEVTVGNDATGFGASWSQVFTAGELGIGRRQPENVLLGWKLRDPMGTIAHCSDTCPSSTVGISPLIWLILIIPGLAICAGVFVYCTRRRRLRRGRNGDAGFRTSECAGRESTAEKAVHPPLASAVPYPFPTGVIPTSARGSGASTDGHHPAQKGELCTICMEDGINTVLLPCAHRAVCLACGRRLDLCPICRTDIQECVQTYDA